MDLHGPVCCEGREEAEGRGGRLRPGCLCAPLCWGFSGYSRPDGCNADLYAVSAEDERKAVAGGNDLRVQVHALVRDICRPERGLARCAHPCCHLHGG